MTSPSDVVRVRTGLEVPLRDGAVLRGNRYGVDGAAQPVILTMTPYGADRVGADRFHARGIAFAQYGFVFVTLDVRGRGDSDGSFAPFANDGPDGFDAVEWLASQSWCDGRVVMWGGSYGGFVQWATAAQAPPHLAAIAPAAAVCPGVDFPMRRNIWDPFVIRWLSLVDGRRYNGGLFEDDAYWHEVSLVYASGALPFRELDRAAIGRDLATFRRWLAHPHLDAQWDALVPSLEQYESMQIPVLTITGHYDDDQTGALHYYDHHTATSPARDQHLLLIGPWDHPGTRSPQSSFGGLNFAEASVIDLDELHASWYDWALARGPKPKFLHDQVTYYHAGSEEWRSAASLEELNTQPLRLHLEPAGRQATSLRQPGLLASAPPAIPSMVAFRSDPADASSSSRAEPSSASPFVGRSSLEEIQGDALVYLTEPLPSDLDLTGRCRLVCQLEADIVDFDLDARLYELTESAATLLCAEHVRARHAQSVREARPWPRGAIGQIEWPEFPWFSRRIATGHRLALVIRPPDRSREINRQSGGRVSDETAHNNRAGVLRVHQTVQLHSYLELPASRSST